MIIPCMVTSWMYTDGLMNEKVPGKPSCSRISIDITNATRPIPIAVQAYWMAITLASWLKTYLPSQVFG